MKVKTWGVYNHNGQGMGTVEAASERDALQKVAEERGYKNTDEAQAASCYWVEEIDA